MGGGVAEFPDDISFRGESQGEFADYITSFRGKAWRNFIMTSKVWKHISLFFCMKVDLIIFYSIYFIKAIGPNLYL